MHFIFSLRFWFVLTTVLLFILSILDQSLRTPQAPFGILSFEFHGFASEPWILDWNTQQRSLMGFNLGLDFLFILVYCTALWIWTSSSTQKKIRQCIQAAIITAALLDVVENICLMFVLWNEASQEWISLTASVCASMKFILLIWVLIGLLIINQIKHQPKQ